MILKEALSFLGVPAHKTDQAASLYIRHGAWERARDCSEDVRELMMQNPLASLLWGRAGCGSALGNGSWRNTVGIHGDCVVTGYDPPALMHIVLFGKSYECALLREEISVQHLHASQEIPKILITL